MTFSKKRFGLSITLSIAVTVFLLYLVISAGFVMGLLPVVGIGGVYAEGESFSGNVGTIYPEYDDSQSINNEPITDTPASQCEVRPMVVFQLENARVEGIEFRKDLQLPFLTNRWMSLRLIQPSSSTGQPAFLSGDQVRLYITQLKADELIIRNIDLREAGPGGVSASGPKWGPQSGELYIEGGDTNGTVLPDGTDGDVADGLVAQDLEVWVHGLEGQSIGFNPGDQSTAIVAELEFPTDGEVANYYNKRLGFDLPEYPNQENPEFPAQSTDRDEYFTCNPIESAFER